MATEQAKNEQPRDDVDASRPELDDSWFDHPARRALVNELRSRLERARIREDQSLDDSWFR